MITDDASLDTGPADGSGPTLSLTVGEVAARSGVQASAVRFYERQGLVSSRRTSGNQRRYDDYAPCQVRICRVAQRVGLTVQEVVALFDAMPHPVTEADWQQLTGSLIGEAERRIAELRATLDDLASGEPLCSLPGVDTIRDDGH